MLPPLACLRLQLLGVSPRLGTTKIQPSAEFHCNRSLQRQNSQPTTQGTSRHWSELLLFCWDDLKAKNVKLKHLLRSRWFTWGEQIGVTTQDQQTLLQFQMDYMQDVVQSIRTSSFLSWLDAMNLGQYVLVDQASSVQIQFRFHPTIILCCLFSLRQFLLFKIKYIWDFKKKTVSTST